MRYRLPENRTPCLRQWRPQEFRWQQQVHRPAQESPLAKVLFHRSRAEQSRCFRPDATPEAKTIKAVVQVQLPSPAARNAQDPGTHVYATPYVRLRHGYAPLAAAQLAIVASRLLPARVLCARSSSKAQPGANHRAARVWASWPTSRASPEGGGRSSIDFSEVCGPPASSRHWRQCSEAALKSVYATQIASSSLVAHFEVARHVDVDRTLHQVEARKCRREWETASTCRTFVLYV